MTPFWKKFWQIAFVVVPLTTWIAIYYMTTWANENSIAHRRISVKMKNGGSVDADEIESGQFVEAPAGDWEKKWVAKPSSVNTGTSSCAVIYDVIYGEKENSGPMRKMSR